MSAENIERHLGPERSAMYWQLCSVVEDLIALYRVDESAALDRIERLNDGEARALLSLALHRITRVR